MNQPEPATSDGLALSYLGLRKGIGFLGLALPIVLVVGKILLDGGGIEGSISGYYYTGMRNYLVGTMCAIGVFLTSYRYRRLDNYLGDVAAAFAVCVALFPTTPAVANLTTAQKVVGDVHLTSAALFFLCLAYFSFFLFTRTDPSLTPTPQKHQRNVVYRVCGIVIVACLVLAVVTSFALTDHLKDELHPLFWLESVAAWAFSVSWLLKGEFLLLKDQVPAI